LDFEPRDDTRGGDPFSLERDRGGRGSSHDHDRDDDWKQPDARSRDRDDDARQFGRGPGNDSRQSTNDTHGADPRDNTRWHERDRDSREREVDPRGVFTRNLPESWLRGASQATIVRAYNGTCSASGWTCHTTSLKDSSRTGITCLDRRWRCWPSMRTACTGSCANGGNTSSRTLLVETKCAGRTTSSRRPTRCTAGRASGTLAFRWLSCSITSQPAYLRTNSMPTTRRFPTRPFRLR